MADKLALAAQAQVAERLRDADATLWGPAGAPEIANRLGWLTIAERMLGEVDDLGAFRRSRCATTACATSCCSAWAAPRSRRRCCAAPSPPDRPRLHVLDSTDAATVRAVEESVDPKRTLFLVSSKSGARSSRCRCSPTSGRSWARARTSSRSPTPAPALADLAREHGFRRTFAGDPDIGGRYSALSPFGIVPAALMGVDVRALLAGAAGAWQTGVSDAWREAAPGATAPSATRPRPPACGWAPP